MNTSMRSLITAAIVAVTGAVSMAQRGGALAPDVAARRWEIEKELQSLATLPE